MTAVPAAALVAGGYGYIFTAIERTYFQGHSTANINDHTAFENRLIKTAQAQPWPQHENYRQGGLPAELTDYLTRHRAAAFIVIHQGNILREQYFGQYAADSKTNSFSMAKTVLTLLLGIAIEEGLIEGLDQKISDWLPEFVNDPYGREATVGSLSTMTSGYDWDEHYYSPFSPTVELLYGSDIESFLLQRGFSHAPETHHYYSSASTQLLAIVLTRAIKKSDPQANLSQYLSEKLWQPLGMNADGIWHLDDSGMELAFCCINTNARNFAKLGQLMLQNGQWRGQQLVPADFVELIRQPHVARYYGYSTWVNPDNEPAFYSFNGHLGQYIVVVPSHELVIVRLGETRSPRGRPSYTELPFYVEQTLKLLGGAESSSVVSFKP